MVRAETPSSGGEMEKDSGVCDDKSDAGTYTLDCDRQDREVEEARQKIEEVFGIVNDESLFTPRDVFAASPESIANSRAFWLSHCQPSRQVNNNATPTSASRNGVEANRQNTFTRPRRGSADEPSSESGVTGRIRSDSYTCQSKSKFTKVTNSSHSSRLDDFAKSRNIDEPRSRGSQSSASVRSDVSNKTTTRGPRLTYSPLMRRRKASDPGHDSDGSSDQESYSSEQYKSDSQTTHMGLKLNRTFALRRARLGIETPVSAIGRLRVVIYCL